MIEPNGLYLTVFWWTLGGLGVAWVLLAGALLARRGRASSQERGEGPRSAFDVMWAVAPAVIVLLVAVPAVRGALATKESPTEAVAADVADGAVNETVQGWGDDTENTNTDAAASSLSGGVMTPGACCATVRQKTTEEDDTEQDDLVN